MKLRRLAGALAACVLVGLSAGAAQAGSFTLQQVLDYPFVSEVAAPEHADRIAWIQNVRGVRNIWVAEGPGFRARQVTNYKDDDGQELTQLTWAPDGSRLLYVRGGDHDANWSVRENPSPNPAASTTKPEVAIWAVDLKGGSPDKIAEGDAPAISAKGVLVYIKDDQAWSAKPDGSGKPKPLFFDRGRVGDLTWSPDGSRLAFTSSRSDHAFIGVFESEDRPLRYLAPSSGLDDAPAWSPDGTRIAFTRRAGRGGAPEPLLQLTPQPWSIWSAAVDGSESHLVWRSPKTLEGSYPQTAGGSNLHWMADGRLTFLADLDNWPHLYSIAEGGGAARLLTPGPFMVEHVVQSRDKRALVYNANTGTTPGDYDRRHLFRVGSDGSPAVPLTRGETLEWAPAFATDRQVAFIGAGVGRPPTVQMIAADGSGRHEVDPTAVPAAYPGDRFVTPRPVTFTAADGTLVHGQLFSKPGAQAKPGVIFVHGGPPRQMLLGWHYMDYYSNGYAVNQYLADHGFAVLSVNYRLGIGYGHRFHHPDKAGPAGASEYQDVVAGARFLQKTAGVDPRRIGIWGGSYGGYLTALALARNSDIFKAGVDLHGVHDWSRLLADEMESPDKRFEQGDRARAMETAFRASPDADIAGWRSPVLLIHGDDDRNVPVQQTVDLAVRLEKQGVPYSEMILPGEIHGFLRHETWEKVDAATAQFLARTLGAQDR